MRIRGTIINSIIVTVFLIFTNANLASVAADNDLKYSDLSDGDKCYIKAFTSVLLGKDMSDDEYNDLRISRERVDQIKKGLQSEAVINDNTICSFVTPDARFSSPESTWSLYRTLLISGKMQEALECFSLDSVTKHRKIAAALGKEKMKQMALEMEPIQKITMDADYAKYRIRKNEGGQMITYYIYFLNIYGNWRIQEY